MKNVATTNDLLERDILSRHDTADRCAKITSARGLIYEGQYVVDTPQVEALLKPESLVPTIVSVFLLRNEIPHTNTLRKPEFIFGKTRLDGV